MTDYIQEAVELANGWSMVDELDLITAPFGVVQAAESIGQGYKDALAAQLVRQIDATDYWVEATSHFADVRGIGISRKWRHEGQDRTMNTIKCIVDFYRREK